MYDMEIHQKISMPDYQKLKTMAKRSLDQKLRLQNFDSRNERIRTGAMATSRRGSSGVERGQRECCQWKAKGQCSSGDKCCSGTMEISVQSRHQKPLHPLNYQHKEVEVRREKGASEAEAILGSSLDSRAKISWKVFAPNHLVTFGILPKVNSVNLNRAVNSVISARLHTGRLKVNPAKNETEWWQKCRLKMQTTFRPDYLWPEIWKDISFAAQRKEKQSGLSKNPKLGNARRLRGIYFIDPADAEFKETVKIARRK